MSKAGHINSNLYNQTLRSSEKKYEITQITKSRPQAFNKVVKKREDTQRKVSPNFKV